jgi:hypothetical protein
VANIFAQVAEENNQSKSLNIKMFIQESINTIEKNQDTKIGGWLIKDRKKSDSNESFIAIIAAPEIDLNASNDNSINHNDKLYETYNNLVGLSIYNDINYSYNSFNAISTLQSFPNSSNMNKKDDLLKEKIIKDKVFVINSHYNINDHYYEISLKDINLSIPNEVAIETKGILANGYYEKNNLNKQENNFFIDLISVILLNNNLFNEYIKMEKLQVISKTKVTSDKLNINYVISMGLLDININSKHSKIEKVNLSITVGNLNLNAYEALLKFSQDNPDYLKESNEFQILAMELFARSKDIFIEVSDLSLVNILIKGENIGPIKINAKISFKGTKEFIQRIAFSPESAIDAFSMKVQFQFPKSILHKVYKKDKAIGSTAILFAKYENENVIYDASFNNGKLIINEQSFPLNNLQKAISNSSIPQTPPIENNFNETKRDLTPKQNKHASKYKQNSMHQAVLSRNINEVKHTLNDTININAVDKLGRTPLHYAAFNGDIDIAQLLLENGANINAVDTSKKWTPLFFAVFMKYEDMVDLLIKKGADQTMKDKLNRTASEYKEKE